MNLKPALGSSRERKETDTRLASGRKGKKKKEGGRVPFSEKVLRFRKPGT